MTDPHMTQDDLDAFAASFGPVALRHLDTIAGLPEPWPGNAYGILAGVARLAIQLGARLRNNTPYDVADALGDLFTANTAGTVREAMGAVRDALTHPLPKPGPARCAWAAALAAAGAELYAHTAGPVV